MGMFGASPEEELLWVRTMEQGRQRAEAAAALWNEADVAHAAHIVGMAPWLSPGTALGLAKGHASPRAIESAARAAAVERAQLPNLARGQRTTGAQMLPGHRRLIDEDRFAGRS